MTQSRHLQQVRTDQDAFSGEREIQRSTERPDKNDRRNDPFGLKTRFALSSRSDNAKSGCHHQQIAHAVGTRKATPVKIKQATRLSAR